MLLHKFLGQPKNCFREFLPTTVQWGFSQNPPPRSFSISIPHPIGWDGDPRGVWGWYPNHNGNKFHNETPCGIESSQILDDDNLEFNYELFFANGYKSY